MTTINIYLTFNRNCKEAMNYYKDAFGGEFSHQSTFREMPAQEGMPPMSEEDKKLMMHMSLPISKETVLMASDAMGPYEKGNNFTISIAPDSLEKGKDLFAKLSDGGKVEMDLQKTFWGSYFAKWEDKFGIQWMMNFTIEE